MSVYLGIDVGSTYTKYCVMEQNGGAPVLTFSSERTPVLQREHFRRRIPELRGRYGGCPVVSCGYGRRNTGGVRTVTELTALAAGAAFLCPDSYAVLDIGGQDTKLICQEGGRLRRFFVNEKCAAGSGLFLGNVLNLLGMEFQEIDLTRQVQPEVRLSSVCAVFAQSEIVELIAEGVSGKAIVQGVIAQVLSQAKALLGKAECGEVTLSGGLTAIPGIGGYAEGILGVKVTVPEDGRYLSAAGCAVLAGREQVQGK